MAISLKVATLHELSTVYGVQDLYDLIEIAVIDADNRRRVAKQNKRDG